MAYPSCWVKFYMSMWLTCTPLLAAIFLAGEGTLGEALRREDLRSVCGEEGERP